MDPLIESLKKLIAQSSETLGADSSDTLMLKQQLAAALAAQGKAPKVFWMQPQSGPDGSDRAREDPAQRRSPESRP